MSDTNKKPTVVVTGDVTIDWNIACRRANDALADAWTADASTSVDSQPGGAALLAELIEAAAEKLRQQGMADGVVLKPDIPQEMMILPGDLRFHHSYAMWSRDQKGIWRVSDFLGINANRRSKTLLAVGVCGLD